jgi:mono/diheme cytochrome c family protein
MSTREPEVPSRAAENAAAEREEARQRVQFSASAWLLLAVATSAVAAAVLGAGDKPDWLRVQQRYAVEHPDFEIALRAAPLGPVTASTPDGQEYCASCHLAGAGYEPAAGLIFAAHPAVGHDPLELGCVPCHGGDPGSTDLHDRAAFGRDAPLPGAQAWVACLQCHDAQAQGELLAPWPAVADAQAQLAALLADHGCQACHQLGARGGLVGPELRAFGASPVPDPTAPYDGRRAQAQLQLEDPRSLQPAARMPTPDLDDEQRALMATWLGLQGQVTDLDQDRWRPGAPQQAPCPGEIYGWFCMPCHGDGGGGLERGRPPGAVPALASALWLAHTSPEMVRHIIARGRPGSLMEGFLGDEGEPILTEGELEDLVDHILTGGLVQRPDRESFRRVASGSCETCHPLRSDYLDGRGPAERAAFLQDHPWRWSLEDWIADEGLEIDACEQQIQDGEGALTTVHTGEQLYLDLCIHCHHDPAHLPADREPSAPRLRGWFQREHHDAGALLASLVLGRPDAPPVKWRHQGITAGEYTPTQLACISRWLEDNP